KYYYEGIRHYNLLELSLAIKSMKKSIKIDKKFIEAYLVLADIYMDAGNTNKAIETYKKSIEIDPDFFPGIYYNLGDLNLRLALYSEAKNAFEKLLTYKNLSVDFRRKTKKKIETCHFAINTIKNPVPFIPKKLDSTVNTKFDEYWPVLTADEEMLVFTRLVFKNSKLKTNGIPNKNTIAYNRSVQEDLYISYKDNSTWSFAKNIGNTLNSEKNEGAQTISVDGRVIYYTACSRDDGKGSCDIYQCYKKNGKWLNPVNISSPVNSEKWEAQPSISSDGKTLYFVSNRSGGKGGKDIWMSEKLPNGNWSKPSNLGDSINTKGNEISPFIHADNKTLYFTSDGLLGMGGYDIYKTVRKNDASWATPVNIGYPINTQFDETGLIVNARGERAFFSSDRYSSSGLDIYEFELYKDARPQQVSYLKGKVFDKETKRKIKAKFELINIENNKIVMQAESDAQNGEFLVCIPTNNNYALNVSKAGYLFYSDNFSLKGIHEISKPFLKDIPLQAIEIGKKLVLRNVFFTINSYELDNRSIAELNKVIVFMENNPGLVVEISGHTDNIGEKDYNTTLSMERAKSVCNYLINNDIDNGRLRFKGYGENEPINTNDTAEGRAQNRRTELKILANDNN
ncbi:MAG: OmpA family protein, partial [Bacteroidales bacterium]|nr:OmpA family protein [Bacteroidales bacterium]